MTSTGGGMHEKNPGRENKKLDLVFILSLLLFCYENVTMLSDVDLGDENKTKGSAKC